MNDLAIIIVNYNTRDLLDQCLRSVYGSSSRIGFGVIVVDNGSTDGSGQVVRQRYAGTRLLECGRNLGFARANNLGIRHADSRYVLLLNSDTEMSPDGLDHMVQFLDACPKAAVVGPRLLNTDLTDQGVARAFPTPMAVLFGRKTLLTRLWPDNPFSKRYLIGRHYTGADPFEVDSVSGACLMARRAAIEEIGLLDERFFMYWEDIDWCYRFKMAGWKVYCVPRARVIHHEGQSSKRQSSRLTAEFHRSVYRYYCKHHAPSAYHPMRWLALAGLSARAALLIGANLARSRVAARQSVKGKGKLGVPVASGSRLSLGQETLEDGS